MSPDDEHDEAGEEREEFGQLLKFTLAGYAGGILLGGVLDGAGFRRSGVGQWLVRTLAGEGESVFEGIYALRRRLSGRPRGMAEAYGWGKLFGMAAPWAIDALSRAGGVNVYGIEGFYIPYFYAMSDQLGASVSGFLFLRRRHRTLRAALGSYLCHPVMLTSLGIVLLVPLLLLAARWLGFSPASQVLTAAEAIAANLCWLPPLAGRLWPRAGRDPALPTP